MSEIEVIRYTEAYKEKWDKFVLTNSVNGSFLQSRKFLDYHKDRFLDHSLLFVRGGSTIVGVCPAAEMMDNGKKCFYSHAGSTFGGIVVGKEYYNLTNVIGMVDAVDEYLKNNGFGYALFKSANQIFSIENNNLIDYMFYHNGYSNYDELSFAIDLASLPNGDVLANLTAKTRNLYKKSLENNLVLKEVKTKEEIAIFYQILCKSLEKYETKPVHSLEELYELYFDRLPENIRFYLVYFGDVAVSGSMVFIINDVFHTQYLAADPDYLYVKPMDFMDTSLILLAKQENKHYFSFGISTEEHGKYLNENLARFKEGFGTDFFINKTFYKEF